MLKKILFYLDGFQRYEFYSVILLKSTISRKIDILAVHVYSPLNLWKVQGQNVKMSPFLGIWRHKLSNDLLHMWICNRIKAKKFF